MQSKELSRQIDYVANDINNTDNEMENYVPEDAKDINNLIDNFDLDISDLDDVAKHINARKNSAQRIDLNVQDLDKSETYLANYITAGNHRGNELISNFDLDLGVLDEIAKELV